MNVKYLIDRAVKEYPDRPALVYKDTRRTFQELNERVNRLANGILGLGVKKGDRVGMLLRNCSEFIEVDFALSRTGIVRVPCNARLTGSDHEYMLNDSGANTLIFGKRFTGEQACCNLSAFICLKMELHWRSNPIGKVRHNLPFFQKLVGKNFTQNT